MDAGYFYNALTEIVHPEQVLRDEPMAAHTTFRIGGPADFFVCPESSRQIAGVRALCREEGVPCFLLGNGSNLLVSDDGFRGVILQILHGMDTIRVEEEEIRAGAGALLSAIASAALAAGLTGFEFASGIPGTLGGACVMNAGAYGGELKDVLTYAEVVTADGGEKIIPQAEMAFGYRTSAVSERQYAVTAARLRLSRGNPDAIRARMEELKEARVSKQPLSLPSAGSTFKRPEGHFAGKLIMEAGLAGFSVRDARVSEKHCGFIVNTGHATARDVRKLIALVIERVEETSGVRLEPEVRFLGDFACDW